MEADYKLGINGFLSSKQIITRVVKIDLSENESPVTAICVPEIRTKLKLHDLSKIIQIFNDKGYVLADQFLHSANDSISNLDFLLGNYDGHVLPQRDVTFGCTPKFVYLECSIGVMLSGSIDRMLLNIGSLPTVAKVEGSVIVSESSIYDSMCDLPSQAEVPSQSFSVLDESGNVNENMSSLALRAIVGESYRNILHYDTEKYEDRSIENDQTLIDYVIENTRGNNEGRLIMPLLWNGKVCDHFDNNFTLSKLILKSNFKDLFNNVNRLNMYDSVIKGQEESGIVERIADLPTFLREHPTCSFLPHMGVFKLDRESTKRKIVFLSNLCDVSDKNTTKNQVISHNQAMLSGPCLNDKISNAFMKLRFGR